MTDSNSDTDTAVFTFQKNVLEKYPNLLINTTSKINNVTNTTTTTENVIDDNTDIDADLLKISNENAILRKKEFSHHKNDIIRLNNGSFGACPRSVMEVCNTLRSEW